ncbi:DUF1056 family protein [Weissella confusa]|jgi:hypothetical protein|uniref:DUF1056 family protein n=1 Tax=Weissella confusa TaxID=1583 RepID=UPI00107FC1A3|nr:DUF1056 family protein [Weissella confusa]MBJ7654392.1 DUF1056 family protein [Weissella confusa]MCT0005050.1 DUF1056 family protein [Weissella confusa]MCT0018739.1 DUF1056 family protein [Weissella confusa]MCT0039376.1 DUF1056 family protein [Weissella confusa]MDY2521203.1 DUF1056 family protein [Weissella confusa]
MITKKIKGLARAIRARLDVILFSLALVVFVLTMFLTINALAGGISLTIALAVAGYGVVLIDNGTNTNRKE